MAILDRILYTYIYILSFFSFLANTTEACLQHEITRLTSENFDLREKIENLNDNIRRLKKMLKTYMKRIEDSGENPRDLDSVNETNYEQVIQRDFSYLTELVRSIKPIMTR